MFTKIVSQLSLSPSAASQLTFYARRLGREKVTRTFSAIAAVLIVGLQFATILAPPTAANAASPSDLIYGGIVSRADLLNRYDDSKQLQHIYSHFGISRSDIAASQHATVNSTDHTLKSLGRVQHLAGDTPIDIDGVTYWQRGLFTWDTGSNIKNGSNYEVFQGHRSADGGYFAIMMHCGNVIVKTNPTPPRPPKPPTPTPVPTPHPTPVPTPHPTPTPTPTPKAATLACVKLQGDVTTAEAPATVRFTGLGTATGQSITDYLFDFGDQKTAVLPTGSAEHVYQTPGKYVAHLQVKGSLGKTTERIPVCDFAITVTSPPAAFYKDKSALNLTQNIDATLKPANAGDQIRYTLITKNTGGTAEDYIVTEHLQDVLEYANATDTGGGLLDEGVMTWPSVSIAPGKTLTTNFTVTIKNPIPDTPVGVSDKYSYDLRLDNIYGTAVHISVAPPLGKQVETASTSLPATGSPISTTIVLLVAGLTLFFYFRNRQLISEIKLLRNDYQGGV